MTAGDDLYRLGIEPVKPSRKSASHGEAGYERSALDAYFTEEWVTRTLVKYVDLHLPIIPWRSNAADDKAWDTIWEPACGDGRMASVLAGAGYRVVASDIADWGYGAVGCDFLGDPREWKADIPVPRCAAIVTNPPFGIAVEFISRALELTRSSQGIVAILQRHEFDAPVSHHALFQITGGVRFVLHKRPYFYIPPPELGVCPEAARRAVIPVNPKTGKIDSARFPYVWNVWNWRLDGAWRTIFCRDPDEIDPGERLL